VDEKASYQQLSKTEVSIAGRFTSYQSKNVRTILHEISSVLGNARSHSLGLEIAIISHLL
jgi:hypothetical protein